MDPNSSSESSSGSNGTEEDNKFDMIKKKSTSEKGQDIKLRLTALATAID